VESLKGKVNSLQNDFVNVKTKKDKAEKLTIKDLRKNNNLKKTVKKQISTLGLLSDSDSSDSSEEVNSSSSSSAQYSTSSYEESQSESDRESVHRIKKDKRRKSGIAIKSQDKVKCAQRYPHTYLRYEFVSKNISFEDLELNLFIAGELEIISDSQTNRTERKGRLELLKRILYLSLSYEFEGLKCYYAAVLREIELGKKKWSDEFQYLEIAILNRFLIKSHGSIKRNSNVNFKTRKAENPLKEESTVWFCASYQRNKCQHKTDHTAVVKGKMRYALHICTTCWQNDQSKLPHPECFLECPSRVM